MATRSSKIKKAILPRPLDQRDEPTLDWDHIKEAVVQAAAEGLAAGQVGIFPTETVYGLIGSACSDEVFDRIYELKGRAQSKPLPIQVHKLSDLEPLGLLVTEHAQVLASNFWPGPLTLVLPFLGRDKCRAGLAPKLLEQWAKNGNAAVRIPDHPVTQMLLAKCTSPIMATSANISGTNPISLLSQLDPGLKRKVDWIVDGGPTVTGRESTVVQCDAAGWRILREGALRGVVIQKAFAEVAKKG